MTFLLRGSALSAVLAALCLLLPTAGAALSQPSPPAKEPTPLVAEQAFEGPPAPHAAGIVEAAATDPLEAAPDISRATPSTLAGLAAFLDGATPLQSETDPIPRSALPVEPFIELVEPSTGEARYFTASGNPRVALNKEGVLIARVASEGEGPGGGAPDTGPLAPPGAPPISQVHMIFVGANPVAPKGEDAQPGHVSFFIGSDPAQWRSGLSTFGRATYAGLYPGIDVSFSTTRSGLEYELMVRPGADLGAVGIRFDGATGIAVLPSGALEVSTPAGPLYQSPPRGFESSVREVPCRFEVGDIATAAISCARHDRGMPLRIDPVFDVSPANLSGGSDLKSLFVGANGNVYAYGMTIWAPLSDMPWGVDSSSNTGFDCWVSEIYANGSAYVFRAYLGGATSTELCDGDVFVDAAGEIYVGGSTGSSDFPTTSGAYLRTYSGSAWDAVATKLNANGTALIYSTYLGWSSWDQQLSIWADGAGVLYGVGGTASLDLPVTAGAVDATYGGGYDGFLYALNTNGSGLVYCTYIGGAGDDFAWSVRLAADGFPIVAGDTLSATFTTTPGANDRTRNGTRDAFIMEIDIANGSFVFSTLVGGNDDEFIYGLDVAPSGEIYAAGYTSSSDWPNATVGTSPSSTNGEILVAVLSADGSTLRARTTVGGSNNDFAYAIDVGPDGQAWVTGYTRSGDFPVTPDATIGLIYWGSNLDAFLIKMSANLTALDYGTHYGASLTGWSVMAAPDGSVFLGGAGVLAKFGLSTAPVNASASSGDRVAMVNWTYPLNDGGANVTVYRLYRSTSPGTETFFRNVTARRFNDTNVTLFQAYYYKVSAVTLFGESPLSAEVTVIPIRVPDEPVNLTAQGNPKSVWLNWSAPAFDGGGPVVLYRLFRGLNATNQTPIATLSVASPPPSMTFVDVNVTDGVAYYYRVGAGNRVGLGNWSNLAFATPRSPPTQVENLSLTVGDAALGLSWDAPRDLGGTPVLDYRIYRGENATALSLVGSAGTNRSATDSGLVNGLTYYYQLRAFNVIGEGPGNVPVAGMPGRVPSEPQNVTVVEGDRYLDLGWQAPAIEGGRVITAYLVYRGDTPSNLSIRATLATAFAFSESSLTNGRTYYYAVAAQNSLGLGALSAPIAATPRTLPGPARALFATAGDSAVTLSWLQPTDDGGSPVTNYSVYRRLVGDPAPSLVGSSNNLSFLDENLSNGQSYLYSVRARNPAGLGPFSSEVTATPIAPPLAPISLAATGLDRAVALTWSAPRGDGGAPISGYRLYRGASVAALAPLAQLGLAFAYNDTAVANGVVYFYAVAAVNAAGEGPRSAAIEARPATAPPLVGGTPPGQVDSGGVASFTFTAQDPDNSGGYAFSLESGPPWAVLSASGALQLKPPTGVHGNFSYAVRLVDAGGGQSVRPLSIFVADKAPVIQYLGEFRELKGDVGATFEINLSQYALDPDDAVASLRWAISGDSSGNFTWTYDEARTVLTVRLASPGTGVLRLSLSDPFGMTDEATVPVQVSGSQTRTPELDLATLLMVALASIAALAVVMVAVRRRKKPAPGQTTPKPAPKGAVFSSSLGPSVEADVPGEDAAPTQAAGETSALDGPP